MEARVSMPVKKILVDADALVSLVNKNDSGHDWAVKTSKKVKENEAMVYLTSYAYGEALTVVSMQMSLDLAVRVGKKIDSSSEYVLVDVDRDLRKKGLAWFSKQSSKNARFTDCVNMALMAELQIEEIFSRDEHYRKNGFIRMGVD